LRAGNMSMNKSATTAAGKSSPSGRAYSSAYFPSSHSAPSLWVLGKYEEEYVRLDGRWKFKTVRFVTIVQAPYEKGWGTLVGRG